MTSTGDTTRAEQPALTAVPTSARPGSPFPGMLARAAIVAGVAVAAALLFAAIALILLAVGSAIIGAASGAGSAGSTGTSTGVGALGGDAARSVLQAGVGMILEIWIVLATSAFFSGATVSVGTGLGSVGSADVFVVPLLLTALIVGATVIAGWVVARRAAGSPIRVRLAEAGLAGGVAVVVTELIAAIGSAKLTVVFVTIGASGFGWRLLLGAFVIAGGSALLGSTIAAAAPSGMTGVAAFRSSVALTARRVPAIWRPFAAVAVVGCVAWVAVTLVIGIIWAATQGSAAPTLVLTAPLWAPTVAFWAAAVGQLGGVLGTGAVGALGASSVQGQSVTVLNAGLGGAGAVAAAVVIALACAVVLRRMQLRRAPARFGILALQVAGAWLVAPYVFATVGLNVDGLGAVSGDLLVLVAPWTFLLAGLWGLGIEAAARYVVPAWSGEITDGTTARRVRSRTVLVAAIVIVAVIGASVVGTAVVQADSPQVAAKRYVDALESGDLKGASAMEGDGAAGVRVAVAKGKAMKNARVVAESSDSTSATFAVSFVVFGKTMQRTLTLTNTGGGPFGLPKWVVAAPLVDTVTFDSSIVDAIEVDGVRFSATQGAHRIPVALYPGEYTVASAGAASALVSFPSVYTGEGDFTVASRATTALAGKVQAAVDATLDTCARSTDAAPQGCPFSTPVFGTYTGLTWHIDTYPTIQVGNDGSTYSSTQCGVASATYLQNDGFEPPFMKTSSDSCVTTQGTVTVDGATVAVEPN